MALILLALLLIGLPLLEIAVFIEVGGGIGVLPTIAATLATALAGSLLLTLAFYSLHAGDFFVFDSEGAIANNSGLRFNALEFDRWRVAALSSDTGVLGRPISNLSFAIDAYLAGGVEARWMKTTNVLLHIIIGLVAWRLFILALSKSPLLGVDKKRARWAATGCRSAARPRGAPSAGR